MNIYNLNDLKETSGGKADGLYKLIKCGVPVPEGFVLNNTNQITNNDIKKINKELKKFDKTTLFAVRSSCNIEDGESFSFAGIFETVLNVKNNEKDIIDAINIVNNSINSEIVKNYSKEKQITMNIIIQKMIDSKKSGVCFTNTIDVDGSKVSLIEYINGLGENLVSGKINSERLIIKYKNGVLDNSGYEKNAIILKLINYLNIIIEKFEYDLDVEWCCDNNDEVYLLQARPITKNIFIDDDKIDTRTGFVASKGYVEGETYVIDTNNSYEEVQKQIDNFEEGKILVTDYTETYFLPAMKKCCGVITNTGSVLCHAAIVSRELNIPCIVGYKDATKTFKTGTKIILDANNNQIIVGNEKIKSNNENQIDFGSLDCFDDYEEVIIDNKKVFIDKTYDGIYIQKPNNLDQSSFEKIEFYVRKKYKMIPKYNEDENKWLWIMEVERFKKLPFFTNYYERIKKASKEFNCEELFKVQEELLELVSKLLKLKSKDIIVNSFVDESIASINELLDGIIPFGYPLLYSYIESKELLDKEKLTFNDLFIKEFKNDKLKKIKEFLKAIEYIKDTSYQKVLGLGGVKPDYYEKRDDTIKQLINYYKDDVMYVFYNNFLEKFINIYEREVK